MSDTTEFKRQRADEAEFRGQRVHDDFNASNEAARAGVQAAILINGGALFTVASVFMAIRLS
jgi:hypothetical protein